MSTEAGSPETPTQERGRIASLRRRAIAYLPAYVMPALSGIAVVPVLTRLLGPREFGIYGVCMGLHLCLLTLASEPTTQALSRFYAMTEGGLAPRRALTRALFGLTLALGGAVLVLALLIIGLAAVVADLGDWGAALVATAAMTAAFTVVQFGLMVRYVQERAVAMSVGQVVHSLGKTLGLIGGAVLAGTAAGSLFGYGIVCLVLAIALSLVVVTHAGPLVDRELWVRALRYGGPLIAVSLSFVVLASFDRYILAGTDGAATAGRYAAAYLLAEGAISLPAHLLRSTVYTAILEAYEAADTARARRLIRQAGDGMLLVGVPVVALFALEGARISELFGGSEYRVADAVPALVAGGVLAYRIGSLESIGFQLVLASAGLARSFLYAIGVAIPVTVVLVSTAGLTGAAVATFVSYVAFYALIRARSPTSDITAYPGRRLGAAVAGTAMVVGLGSVWGSILGLAVGLPLWALAALAVVRR